MKTLAAVPASLAGARTIRQPRVVRFGIAARRSPLKRFRQFIERTDWDERYLCGRWIDRFCLGSVALALGYFGLLFSVLLPG
jgi:hypothetical protein